MDGSYRDRYAKQYEGLVGSLAPQKKKRDQFGELLQNLAPLAGPAASAVGMGIGGLLGSAAGGIGAVPGAAIGSAIGGAAGQALGLGAGEIGAGMTEKYDEEEMRRAALFNALMGMR